jgi:hypothetical protein
MQKDEMTSQHAEVRALSGEEIDTVNGAIAGFLLAIPVGVLIGYGLYKWLD